MISCRAAPALDACRTGSGRKRCRGDLRIFADRKEAGQLLARQIPPVEADNAVVIALPRGGLPVAAEIARSLKLPLDIAIIRKVGAPWQPELAVAAISLNPDLQMTVNHDVARALGLDNEDIRRLAEREMPELVRRQKAYRGSRPPVAVAGKTVILVDDGVATGATVRAALRLITDAGAQRIILALPVAPKETVEELKREADLVICLDTPVPFIAVGAHYRDFDQVSDAEVTQILEDFSGPGGSPERHDR